MEVENFFLQLEFLNFKPTFTPTYSDGNSAIFNLDITKAERSRTDFKKNYIQILNFIIHLKM